MDEITPLPAPRSLEEDMRTAIRDHTEQIRIAAIAALLVCPALVVLFEWLMHR